MVDEPQFSQQQPTFGRRGLSNAPMRGAGSSVSGGQQSYGGAAAPKRNAIWDEFAYERGSEGAVAQENFGPAGFWIRVVASFLDSLLVLTIIFAITMAATRTIGAPFEAVYLLMSVIVPVTYYPLFHSGEWQATPGKRLAGIYVTRSDGGPLSVPHALGRYVAFGINTITLGIGFIIAAFHSQKKALHDHLAGTRVVRGRTR
jgi:uncharacterized RDD family membrane protein YckC